MTIDRIRKQGNDITKLGTDLAVPDSAFRELFNMYYNDLELFSRTFNDLKDPCDTETEYAPDKNVSFKKESNQKYDASPGDLKLNYAVFGHIGDNHLHVNIIPHNKEEYSMGRELVRKWAEKAAALGGTVSAEHGTGRLKKEYLEIMYGREES